MKHNTIITLIFQEKHEVYGGKNNYTCSCICNKNSTLTECMESYALLEQRVSELELYKYANPTWLYTTVQI